MERGKRGLFIFSVWAAKIPLIGRIVRIDADVIAPEYKVGIPTLELLYGPVHGFLRSWCRHQLIQIDHLHPAFLEAGGYVRSVNIPVNDRFDFFVRHDRIHSRKHIRLPADPRGNQRGSGGNLRHALIVAYIIDLSAL